MKLTPRLGQALTLAIEAHDGQVRKGTNIPYISHPIAVASIALEHGADEDQAIAALLHDAIEDGGRNYENRIRVQFGERVIGIVNGCTDGVPDDSGQKAPWEERKLKYIKHLAEASDDVLLVSGSDKLHNARSIVADLMNSGQSVFDRFTATKEQTLWYYESLTAIFEKKGTPTAKALRDVVNRMKSLSGVI
jgi:(p)ppGpp synthase/HD superfamily hydrolase